MPVADDFRAAFCYTRPVNEVLRAHESTLRVLFNGLATAGGVKEAHISLPCFQAFLVLRRARGDFRNLLLLGRCRCCSCGC